MMNDTIAKMTVNIVYAYAHNGISAGQCMESLVSVFEEVPGAARTHNIDGIIAAYRLRQRG